MGNILIALMAAAGVGTWLYTIFMKRSGNNTQNSLITAGIIGIFVFVVVYTVAISIDDLLS